MKTTKVKKPIKENSDQRAQPNGNNGNNRHDHTSPPPSSPASNGGFIGGITGFVGRIFAYMWHKIKWGIAIFLALIIIWVSGYAFINPPMTPYMISQWYQLDKFSHTWVAFSDISPNVTHAVVAAEDAQYCLHWGFDTAALRRAINGGAVRGGSTITQKAVNNLFLWPHRSWITKAIETIITPLAEAILSKQRILEIYLNVAEFGKGVFGIKAAAHHYFNTTPDKLSLKQAALLAAILPNPKGLSPLMPSDQTRARAQNIVDGAKTVMASALSTCFDS